MEKRYILALDEGTTSVRTVLYDTHSHKIVCQRQLPFKQLYPKAGWVEQDAAEICDKQLTTLRQVIADSQVSEAEIIGLGITNQRETVVAWNRLTGEPVYHAIVWQCRRTSEYIKRLPNGIKRKIRNKTGLIPDAYFSASKMKWIIDNVPRARGLLKAGNLCLGTIDSYLAFRLTGQFVTDTTNASRTMLFNIHTLQWDKELLEYFKIPESALPKVVPCNHIVGRCKDFDFDLCGIIGDQQSSLFGQACTKRGMTKATYGTGCFILMNVGQTVPKAKNELATIAYTIGNRTNYALEGSVFSACNAIDWLKNNLGLYDDVTETSAICKSLEDNDGVYFVPAFTGLGAPFWDSFARGTIVGMTLGTGKAQIIRSCFESIAYNVYSIIKDMTTKNVNIKELHIDGGGSKNEFLCQFQSNMIQRTVIKSKESESTALGAIYMAGIAKNVFSVKDVEALYSEGAEYNPTISYQTRNNLYTKWHNAVKVARSYSKSINK